MSSELASCSACLEKELDMLIIICITIGLATGVAVAKLVHKTEPLWPQAMTGVAGGLFGGFLLQGLEPSPMAIVGLLLAPAFGAVGAVTLAHSLRQPMGTD
jgi:uncharacterized membrane protein YeaQ/YmgE (transglycosylase-associated protein family)